MNLPTDPFLNDWIRDVGVVASLIGLVLAVVGFLVGAAKLYAALSSLEEARKTYARYVFSQASRVLGEAANSIASNAWTLAAIRLRDAGQLLAQLGPDWEADAQTLSGFADSFDRLASGDLKRFASFANKWSAYHGTLAQRVSAAAHPFGLGDGETK